MMSEWQMRVRSCKNSWFKVITGGGVDWGQQMTLPLEQRRKNTN